MTIAVGGFGLCGVPFDLIEAVRDSGVTDLTIVSNNMGVDGLGLGLLLENQQVSKVIASYVGENKLFAQPVPRRERSTSSSSRRARSPNGCAPAAPASPPSTPARASAPRSPRASPPPSSTASRTCRSAPSSPTCPWCTHTPATATATCLPARGAQLQPARRDVRADRPWPRPSTWWTRSTRNGSTRRASSSTRRPGETTGQAHRAAHDRARQTEGGPA